MRNRNKKNKKEKTKKSIIGRIMYIFAGVLAVLLIPVANSISYDYFYSAERLKGYTMEDMDLEFNTEDYGALLRETSYNKAIGRNIPDEEKDYYLFADYYDSIINYYVCLNSGEYDKAAQLLSECDTYYNQMTHKVFKEKAVSFKEKAAK